MSLSSNGSPVPSSSQPAPIPHTTPTHQKHSKDKIVPRTEMEKRMAEALSNKNWGASSTLMNQIAADTYD